MSAAAPAVGAPTSLPASAPPAPKAPPAPPKAVAPAAPPAPDAPKADAPAPPDETAAEKRIRLKYKQGGKEIDRDFTTDEITRKLQLAEGNADRARKVDEYEAQQKTRSERIKKDGLKALREEALANGMDEATVDQQIEDYVLEKFKTKHKPNDKGEWEERTPAELEMDELRKFKADATERETKAAEKQRVAAEEAEAAALSDRFAKEILPITQALGYGDEYTRVTVVPAIAKVFDAADAAGVTLTTAQAAAEAKEILDWQAQEHFTNMDDATFTKIMSDRVKGVPPERLAQMLGTEAVDAFLDWTVAQLRGAPAKAPEAPRAERPARGLSEEDKMDAARNAMVYGQRRQR